MFFFIGYGLDKNDINISSSYTYYIFEFIEGNDVIWNAKEIIDDDINGLLKCLWNKHFFIVFGKY